MRSTSPSSDVDDDDVDDDDGDDGDGGYVRDQFVGQPAERTGGGARVFAL